MNLNAMITKIKTVLRIPVEVKVKVLPGGKMPERKTDGAAGWDCYAAFSGVIPQGNKKNVFPRFDEDRDKYYLDPLNGQTIKLPLGICLEMPKGVFCDVRMRSGMGLKNRFVITNGVGTIDSDYRGQVSILLREISLGTDNNSPCPSDRIYAGDRVAQLVFNVPVKLVQVDELSETERGSGGFGSTGK